MSMSMYFYYPYLSFPGYFSVLKALDLVVVLSAGTTIVYNITKSATGKSNSWLWLLCHDFFSFPSFSLLYLGVFLFLACFEFS